MADDFITLYRPDIFERFRGDGFADPLDARQWFASCLAFQYDDIAKRHSCEIRISPTRLEEVRLLWKRDTGRIDILGDTIPDHFKQAGFLAYWLRRRMVVGWSERHSAQHPTAEQDRFLLAVNEVCAFLVGLRLCVYFEYKDLIDSTDHIGHRLQELHLARNLKFDIATLLRHKNVSPHALYLIYRTLFYDMTKPEWNAPVLSLVR
ncbi:MAG TPA: hypothetical protein VGC77_01505 [Rhodopseudomonas sp.]|uniref:hypothetical protein n=1 Tax=Rhodopseudomonas sp. TaxID=1078 RepID=UPI002ED7BB42